MIKAKDGAKVIQLVPVPMIPQREDRAMEGDSLLVVPHFPEKFMVTNNDVLYLAVMDDGSIRPVGKISAEDPSNEAGQLAFLDEAPGFGARGIIVRLAVD